MDIEQVQTSVKLKCKYRLGFFLGLLQERSNNNGKINLLNIGGGSEKKIIETRGKSFLIGILVMKT